RKRHEEIFTKYTNEVFPLTFPSNFTFFFSFTYFCGFLVGVLLLENPKGDNTLDLLRLKSVVSGIFDIKNVELAVFHGETEIQNQTDLLSLRGKTLCVTAGSAPAVTDSPGALLCQYIDLQLLNADPQECLKGTVATLLLENPLGQNGLTYEGLLCEAAKVFGLRSRKLKLFLNEAQMDEITEEIPMKTLNTKTVYVSVLPATADLAFILSQQKFSDNPQSTVGGAEAWEMIRPPSDDSSKALRKREKVKRNQQFLKGNFRRKLCLGYNVSLTWVNIQRLPAKLGQVTPPHGPQPHPSARGSTSETPRTASDPRTDPADGRPLSLHSLSALIAARSLLTGISGASSSAPGRFRPRAHLPPSPAPPRSLGKEVIHLRPRLSAQELSRTHARP
ncbi:hypothetical protein MC885_010103, partial [Smutsia gigantea]